MAAALPLDDQLCFSLYAASMAVNRAYKPTLDALGLTYPQYLVLHTLWEQDGRTVGGIAERLALESSTVTPPVKRLEAAGFVTRKRSQADERQVHVWLTEGGTAIRQRCGRLTEDLLQSTGMTGAELGTLNLRVQSFLGAVRGDKNPDE